MNAANDTATDPTTIIPYLAAVTDTDTAGAEAAAKAFGTVAAPDLKALLRMPGVQAVYVATPNHLHKEHVLAAAGRTTLTIYVLHALMFNLLVNWLEWVKPAGLGTALVLATGFWMFAIIVANLLQLWRGTGPLEWVYRRFSDPR